VDNRSGILSPCDAFKQSFAENAAADPLIVKQMTMEDFKIERFKTNFPDRESPPVQ
jgi:hypothetical protein